MDTTLAQPSTQPDTSVGLTLGEYAERVGLSVWTVRAKIRRGEIPAQLVKGRRGPEYRIAPDATVGQGLDNPNAQPSPSVAPRLDQPDTTVRELIALVREKDQTIVELAGRCGWLQSELEQARAVIRQLQAPNPVENFPQGSDLTNWSAEHQNGPDSSVQSPGSAEIARERPSDAPNSPVAGETSNHTADPVIPAARPWWRALWKWGGQTA